MKHLPAGIDLATLQSDIVRAVAQALAEDVGSEDVSAALIDPATIVNARVITREDGIFCGAEWAREACRQVDERIEVTFDVEDGDRVRANQRLFGLRGPARGLLTAERTLLNFVQLLSGTATRTRYFADLIAHTGATLLDTRKTIPGLRLAQKYAVLCGGGANHRLGLWDQYLIKENHIAAAGSVTAAIAALRAAGVRLPIEIEVERLDQIEPALAAGADMLLLDNFSFDMMREAVKLAAGRVKLEASGGFTLADLPAIGATGVDFVSVGSLTKHLRATDLSMRIVTR